ncbi:unnamed protein product [Caenorhabditis auriculariae]|uniref:Uncharacterized protein n=1 Tax=Caenorhabditis auriculariae TaxID=2777116 RepID=A0A8S1H5K7_9PELO|nr:unnamed protein product [Caenorhabditis auriculariae]
MKVQDGHDYNEKILRGHQHPVSWTISQREWRDIAATYLAAISLSSSKLPARYRRESQPVSSVASIFSPCFFFFYPFFGFLLDLLRSSADIAFFFSQLTSPNVSYAQVAGRHQTQRTALGFSVKSFDFKKSRDIRSHFFAEFCQFRQVFSEFFAVFCHVPFEFAESKGFAEKYRLLGSARMNLSNSEIAEFCQFRQVFSEFFAVFCHVPFEFAESKGFAEKYRLLGSARMNLSNSEIAEFCQFRQVFSEFFAVFCHVPFEFAESKGFAEKYRLLASARMNLSNSEIAEFCQFRQVFSEFFAVFCHVPFEFAESQGFAEKYRLLGRRFCHAEQSSGNEKLDCKVIYSEFHGCSVSGLFLVKSGKFPVGTLYYRILWNFPDGKKSFSQYFSENLIRVFQGQSFRNLFNMMIISLILSVSFHFHMLNVLFINITRSGSDSPVFTELLWTLVKFVQNCGIKGNKPSISSSNLCTRQGIQLYWDPISCLFDSCRSKAQSSQKEK